MNDVISLSSNFSYSLEDYKVELDRQIFHERVNLRSRPLVKRIKNIRKLRISILILGNHASAQQRANFFNGLNLFQDAVLNRLGIELVTDEWDLTRIRKLTTVFTEEDLAMELAKSHMHYIVCHPHQGTDGLGWSANTLYRMLRKHLYWHPGFPYQGEFFCPVWSQEKVGYLCRVPFLINPTLVIAFDKWFANARFENYNLSYITRFVKCHFCSYS